MQTYRCKRIEFGPLGEINHDGRLPKPGGHSIDKNRFTAGVTGCISERFGMFDV